VLFCHNVSAALSISEEKNRAIKAMQEKTAVLHQLHRAQVDLEGAQGELARANEELAAQREKVKAFHAAKIAADKRVAEASTANSKTEVHRALQIVLTPFKCFVTVCSHVVIKDDTGGIEAEVRRDVPRARQSATNYPGPILSPGRAAD
jgi:hypothetical protein